MYKRTFVGQDEYGLYVFLLSFQEQDQFLDAPDNLAAGSVIWTDPSNFEERPEVGPSSFTR